MKKIKPGPGQESVWDYPRPPRVEASSETIEIFFGGEKIASSSSTYRVLETSHPPTYYIPKKDFVAGVLQPVSGTSFCEFKGRASYFDVVVGERIAPKAAWTYPDVPPSFKAIEGYIALYPGKMDRCTVNGEEVQAQEGDYYGGWITGKVVGPFKGAVGTWGW